MTGRRLILHVDMDAFFVSVELLRNEHLRGTPVIVGGDGRRGVVAAASYEARVYGVHSALPSALARRRCPQAVFLPGDHGHYQSVSARVMDIFARFSPAVEPISLDEAFLDITGTAHLFGGANALGEALRSAVYAEEHLHCSVGIAPNKFLAKMASEAAKPTPSPQGPIPGHGVFIVDPDGVEAFLNPLPARALWGVGKSTRAKLERIGIETIGDLAATELSVLQHAVGKSLGEHLSGLAHGRDERPVVTERAPKSISHEQTYAHDVDDRVRLDRDVLDIADRVADRLRAQGLIGRRITLKIRFGDFTTWTRQHTLASGTGTASRREIAAHARELLAEIDVSPGVRLIGVGVAELFPDDASPEAEQLSFDALLDGAGEDERQEWARADEAVADIRARFGAGSIGPAALISHRDQSFTQWGPQGKKAHRKTKVRDARCRTNRLVQR